MSELAMSETDMSETDMSDVLTPWTHEEMAARVARDIPAGWAVNLGIGLPVKVADRLPADRDILLHSENGILGMGPAPAPGEEDADLINASKTRVTALPGASFFHQADSFAIMRGGWLDLCVLGAMQVAANGDLANWSTGEPGAIPGVGGAMDLASGARAIWVMSEHRAKSGAPKLVERCRFPLTAKACVARVYTDLAVVEVTQAGFVARELCPGLTLEALQAATGAPIRLA
jgi:3-oxoadipate CoA-transferase beta subunit